MESIKIIINALFLALMFLHKVLIKLLQMLRKCRGNINIPSLMFFLCNHFLAVDVPDDEWWVVRGVRVASRPQGIKRSHGCAGKEWNPKKNYVNQVDGRRWKWNFQWWKRQSEKTKDFNSSKNSVEDVLIKFLDDWGWRHFTPITSYLIF